MPIRDEERIRLAAAAGRFYEGNTLLLRRQMAETEAGLRLPPPADSMAHGCILPHAGYSFSLAAAMRTLADVRGRKWSRAVVLGPSHYVGFRGIAYTNYTRWRTPFGDLPTATDAMKILFDSGDPLFVEREDAHRQEHSLEVQFPLLQYFFENIPVCPLVVGQLSLAEIRRWGKVFARLAGPETLWVISSDFTHYGERFHYVPFGDPVKEQLWKLDGEAAELIVRRDLDGFAAFLNRTGATICGALPIALYLALLEELDPQKNRISGSVRAHADSGEPTGDYHCVVDYVGITFAECEKQ